MTPTEAIDRIKQLLFGTTNKKFNFIKEAKEYMAAFPLIAQSLVEQSGKKIQLKSVRGALGLTDGTTIYVTPTPMPTKADDLDNFLLFMAMKMGLIHHEIGHVNHTDFTTKRSKDKLTGHLEGLIEDIRQERVHMSRFRSAKKYLDALEIAMFHQGINAALQPDAPPIQVFTTWLYFRLRFEFCGQAYFEPELENAQVIFEKTFGRGIVPKIEYLIAKVPGLRNTQDALSLADDIRELIVDEINEQEKKANQLQAGANGQGQSSQSPSGQPGSQQSNQNGQSPGQQSTDDPQDGQGNAAGQQSGDDDQDGQGNAAGQQSNGSDDGSDQAHGNGSGGSQNDQSDDPQQTLANLKGMLNGDDDDQAVGDKDELVKQMMQALADELAKNGAFELMDDFKSIEDADSTPNTHQLLLDRQDNIKDAVGVVSKLSSSLRRQLQAKSMDKSALGIKGNKVHSRALLKVPLGDARIFKRIHRAKRLDTAVCIMTDISGSMDGPKIRLANQAIFATACAIERLPQCKVAVGTFPLNQVVLPFGMRASKNMNRFMLDSTGCTPMHQGISMGFALLNRRREERKVLFVVTDGEPDNANAVVNTILAQRRLGIEVYAIGIQTCSVKNLFENWAVIKQIEDLPKVVFDMLDGKLFQAA